MPWNPTARHGKPFTPTHKPLKFHASCPSLRGAKSTIFAMKSVGVRDRLRPDLRVHLAAAEAEAWASPDFSRVSMPPGFPDALRRAAKWFLNEYRSQMRPFETEYEVALGVLVHRTGGHTPGAQRGPAGVRRRPADVRRRRRVPGRVRASRLV